MIDKEWIDFVNNEKNSDILHDPQIIKIFSDEWNCTSFHKVLETDLGKIGVPAYIIKNSFLGKKITTQPFLYFPKLLGHMDDTKAIEHLINKAKNLGKKWFVEYKSHQKLDSQICKNFGIKTVSPLIDSTLFLENSYDDQIKNFQKRFLVNIKSKSKKLEQEKIIIKSAETEDEIKKFYDLLCKSYKNKHRILCHPQSLFLNLFLTLKKSNSIDFILAIKNQNVIAGIIVLKKNSTWNYSWGAYDESLQNKNLNLNTLLINSAIKDAISKKMKIFSFGSTSVTDKNLLMYKTHWGCSHESIYYHYWNKEPNVLDVNEKYFKLRSLFRIMPMPIFKFLSKEFSPRLA